MYATDNKYVVDKLFDDFFEWRLMDNPEYGTNIGLHKYDDQISQWTEEAFLNSMVGCWRIFVRVDYKFIHRSIVYYYLALYIHYNVNYLRKQV